MMVVSVLALLSRLGLTSGLALLLPPVVLALWGREHAEAAAFALGWCGWLALWTMGAHVPLTRALMLAAPGPVRRQVVSAGWTLAWLQVLLLLLCAAVWLLWAVDAVGSPVWTPVVKGWSWSLAAVWATFPLANAALAHWYALERFATGNVWVLLPRMGVLCAAALVSPLLLRMGWAWAVVLLAFVAWLLTVLWLVPLRRLRPDLLALPLACATRMTRAPGVATLWREHSHYLLWGLMMACYGPLPLVWAGSQGAGSVLLLATALSVSGLLALYLSAACVPWMVEVQKHANIAAYPQTHQRLVWRHVAGALLFSLVACLAVLPWYGNWLLGRAEQASLLVFYTCALLVAQAARLLSLATTQCAAAMRLERLLHPAAMAEMLVVLLLMFAWSSWPGALGFVAALCTGFLLRGLMALTFESRLIRRRWAAIALSNLHNREASRC